MFRAKETVAKQTEHKWDVSGLSRASTDDINALFVSPQPLLVKLPAPSRIYHTPFLRHL